MGLRARISLFVFCAVTLLTGGILVGAVQLDRLTREDLARAVLASQHAIWQIATARLIDGLTARLAALPAEAQVAALEEHSDMALSALLGAPAPDGLRAELLDAAGRPLLARSPGGPEGGSVLDAGLLARVLDDGEHAAELDRDAAGTVLATVAAPIRQGGQTLGALVLSQPVAPSLAETGKIADSALFLIGLNGEPLPGGTMPMAPDLQAMVTPPHPGLSFADFGARVLRICIIPLPGRSGTLMGYELSATNVTDSYWREVLLRVVGLTAVVLFALTIQATLYLYLSRSFRPLERAMAALKALAAGDTTVDVAGEGRQDEVGRVAAAVRIVRDLKREEARADLRQQRQQRRQEQFIHRQMLGLADTLDAAPRAALLADLERIKARARDAAAQAAPSGTLGAIAVAFRYMAGRVKQQHADLARLVDELREALAAKTELVTLQQHLAIAGRMQTASLPKPLPPRREVDIHASLLPAREMGGDFYDFFPRPDGRILVAAGEVAGSGLATAFMMLIARTLLKALQRGGLEPLETIERMDPLLAAENEQALAVRLFVGLLDPASGRLHYANAGYAAPLLVRRVGEVVDVRLADSTALALGGATSMASGVLDLPPRATLLLASHGASDVADRFGRVLGREGLAEAVQGSDDLGPQAVCDAARAAILAIAPQARDADATCLAIRYLGA